MRSGGEGGIRTHGAIRTPLFESGTFNHSDTSPPLENSKGARTGDARRMSDASCAKDCAIAKIGRFAGHDSGHDLEPSGEQIAVCQLDG